VNTRTSLICAAVIGFGFLTAAQAASSQNGTDGQTMAELSTGKTGRIAIPAPRPDREAILISASGSDQTPVNRTKSGIRIIGAPFFPTDM
jgi:hypothetical protein